MWYFNTREYVMQIVPKTQRLLAEEVAQSLMDGSDKEIRGCIKKHGRALTRRLIVALWFVTKRSKDDRRLMLESINALTHLDNSKLKGLVQVLEQS